LPSDVEKEVLHQIHWQAWKKGVKSLYYCRSKSIQRAEAVSQKEKYNETLADGMMPVPSPDAIQITLAAASPSREDISENDNDYEECLSCQ
jgi:ribonucleoside-diphosphate reductase alpha chain